MSICTALTTLIKLIATYNTVIKKLHYWWWPDEARWSARKYTRNRQFMGLLEVKYVFWFCEFTRGSEGSIEPDWIKVLLDEATAAMLSHPTSSGLIRWSAEMSNVEQSFQGQVEIIHSTGSSHAERLADACITTPVTTPSCWTVKLVRSWKLYEVYNWNKLFLISVIWKVDQSSIFGGNSTCHLWKTLK